jgi:copper chaperone CopZ
MTNKKTSPKKTTKKIVKKKKMSKASILLIIGLIIIAIPFIIWGAILFDASSNSNNPVIGERFTNDLDPAIENNDVSSIKTSMEAISGVEAVEVNLKTATLRINIDADDSITKEEMLTMLDNAYNKVDSQLSVSKYFTSTSTKRMYDLEIHIYNSLDDVESDSYIYVQLIKNSMMVEAEKAVVSEPKDPQLVADMYAEENAVVEETTTPEGQEEIQE